MVWHVGLGGGAALARAIARKGLLPLCRDAGRHGGGGAAGAGRAAASGDPGAGAGALGRALHLGRQSPARLYRLWHGAGGLFGLDGGAAGHGASRPGAASGRRPVGDGADRGRGGDAGRLFPGRAGRCRRSARPHRRPAGRSAAPSGRNGAGRGPGAAVAHRRAGGGPRSPCRRFAALAARGAGQPGGAACRHAAAAAGRGRGAGAGAAGAAAGRCGGGAASRLDRRTRGRVACRRGDAAVRPDLAGHRLEPRPLHAAGPVGDDLAVLDLREPGPDDAPRQRRAGARHGGGDPVPLAALAPGPDRIAADPDAGALADAGAAFWPDTAGPCWPPRITA